MTQLRLRRPRLRLDPKSYRKLRQEVLERDGWRCQGCGSSASLQIHHVSPRGRMGNDSASNLITLCVACHQKIHRRKLNR